MKTSKKAAGAIGATLGVSLMLGLAPAQAERMVGGAPMYPSRNIVQNGSKAKNLTTLVAAVKAAGLVSTLEGPGPFTVFAPDNAAFAALPKGTTPTLLKPENKAELTDILTYHVVPGRLTEREIDAKIRAGHGEAMMKTVEGKDLTFMRKGRTIYVKDAKGGVARVIDADVMQSNGAVDVINKVLMP